MSHCFLIDQGVPLAIFESYESMEWTRHLYEPSTLTMTINRHVDGAHLLAPGLEFGVTDDPHAAAPDFLYVIEQVENEQDETGRAGDMVTVTAKEFGLFDERICLPPPHELPLSGTESHHTVTGPAETAMKAFVSSNVGPNAPASRRLMPLLIEADQGRGVSGTYSARFETLAEKLKEVGMVSGLGWEVRFDNINGTFTFVVVPEVDKTASVVFDRQFDNLLGARWLWSFSDLKNVAYVAGQGEGTARAIEKVFVPIEPAGQDVARTETTQADFQQGTLNGVAASAAGDVELVPSHNLCPPFEQWTMGGGAFVDANGVLNLNAYGDSAQSPLIPIDFSDTWFFSAEYLDDNAAPVSSVNPDGLSSVRLLGSSYFDSVGNSTTNSNGFSSNGNARPFGSPGEWSDRSSHWNGDGGGNVKYIKISISASSPWTSSSYQAKKPMLTINNEYEQFESYQGYHPSGSRTSPALDLSPVGTAAGNTISWTQTVPANTTLAVETSLDSGATWQPATNGGTIPGINSGDDMAGKSLLVRQSLSTTDTTVTPQLHELMVEVKSTKGEPTGPMRREMFIDARDESDVAALISRGEQKLAEQTVTDLFEVEINPYANFRYREHWDLGDLVTVRSQTWGLERTARIVSITNRVETGSGETQRTISLGKTFPTIRDRVKQEIGENGSRRA